jgi:hypothetical protein
MGINSNDLYFMDVFKDENGVCYVLVGFSNEIAHTLTHHQVCNISDADWCRFNLYTHICSRSTFETYAFVERLHVGSAAFIKIWEKAKSVHLPLIRTPYPIFTKNASQRIIVRGWKAYKFRKDIKRLRYMVVKHQLMQELYYLPEVGFGYYACLESWTGHLKFD